MQKKWSFEDGVDYIIPDSFDWPELVDDFHEHMALTAERYHAYIANGVPTEDARSILPNATVTELYMTANFRQWRLFLDVRGSKHAQKEIRQLAGEIHHELVRLAPWLFHDYKATPNKDGGWNLLRPDYVNPDGWIYYRGKEYNTAKLVAAYKRENVNDTKKETKEQEQKK